ncbi:MAG: hypothetical protein P4L81_05865 [Candidatus Pacebacteria bacterium]|nr:hypothetical protein [Candidatus Paceibacterota bacterium]
MTQVSDACPYQPGTNESFDWRMEQRIISVCERSKWEEILDILCRAHDNDNLRRAVKELFVRECPSKWMKVHLEAVTGPTWVESKEQLAALKILGTLRPNSGTDPDFDYENGVLRR